MNPVLDSGVFFQDKIRGRIGLRERSYLDVEVLLLYPSSRGSRTPRRFRIFKRWEGIAAFLYINPYIKPIGTQAALQGQAAHPEKSYITLSGELTLPNRPYKIKQRAIMFLPALTHSGTSSNHSGGCFSW
jgi:hypothetical protein